MGHGGRQAATGLSKDEAEHPAQVLVGQATEISQP